MPFNLVSIIPAISTERMLVAFICLLIAWFLILLCSRKLRAPESLIKTALPKERLEALKAVISYIDPQSLTQEQRFELAMEHRRAKRSEHRHNRFLAGFGLILLALVGALGISRVYPESEQHTDDQPPNYAQGWVVKKR